MTPSDKTRRLEAFGAGHISIEEVSGRSEDIIKTPASRRQELEYRAAQLQLAGEIAGAMATESVAEQPHDVRSVA
jgi:hypothetical protein